ncbi:hypothetical protein Hanom_Chr16g01459461 [Helianthus anomalus]
MVVVKGGDGGKELGRRCVFGLKMMRKKRCVWIECGYCFKLYFLILMVFKSFHSHLTEKTNIHLRQGLSGNKIEKFGDYSYNFRKLETKGEKTSNHKDYPGI